jgi:hypothetical protein
MKKIILVIMALTALVSAQYETFVTKTGDNIGSGKTTLVYFGEYKDFVQDAAEVKKYVAANGIQGALTGLTGANQALAQGLLTNGASAGLTGAGIGMVIGFLDPYVMDLWADTTYFMIKRIEKGSKVSFKKVLLVSDTDMSADEAKQIMNTK